MAKQAPLRFPAAIALACAAAVLVLPTGADARDVKVKIVVATAGILQTQNPKYGSPCSNMSKDSCLSGYPALATTIRHERARDNDASILMGDLWQTDRLVQLHADGIGINEELWSRLDVDVMKMNEPFFLSWKNRMSVASYIARSKHPLVATNLVFVEDWQFFRGLFTYTKIMEPVPGVRIGFVAAYPKDFWFQTTGFASTLRDYITFLRHERAETIFLLVPTNTPVREKQSLLESGADVILFRPQVHTTAEPEVKVVGGVHLIEARKLSNVVEVVSLRMQANGTHSTLRGVDFSYNRTNGPLPDHLRDDAFHADRAYTQKLYDEAMKNDKKFGVSTHPMPAGYWKDSEGKKYSPCRHEECELGTLVSEAMVAAKGDEIALINGGGLRAGWPQGDILRSHVGGAVPFQNYLCHLNLTAAGIYRALEQGASSITSEGKYNTSLGLTGNFLQVHGMRYVLNPENPPYSRVTNITVPGPEPNTWVPIDPTRPYAVVTVNYLCDGGDGFDLRPHNGVMELSATDIWSLVSMRISDHGTITPHLKGAIKYTPGVGAPMDLIKVQENCTTHERFLTEWETCERCRLGYYHPEPGDTDCIVEPQPPTPPAEKDAADLLIVVLPVGCGVLLIIAAAAALNYRGGARRRAELNKYAPKQGDISFVFTDIFQSSDLWDKFPTDMAEALKVHHAVIRDLIRLYEGYEVKTIGDSFMVAFTEPLFASCFLVDLQQALLKAQWPQVMSAHPACAEVDGFRGLRVRAGLHVGPANLVHTPAGGYDYDGHVVNVAARVSDSGEGGQVVITEAAYSAIEGCLDQLPHASDVKYLGEYRFKGIGQSVGVYQLMPEDLSACRHFGPLRNATQTGVQDVSRQDSSGPVDPQASLLSSNDEVDKKEYTAALQELRRWAGRAGGQMGATVHQISELLCSAVAAGRVPNEHVVTALLQVVQRARQKDASAKAVRAAKLGGELGGKVVPKRGSDDGQVSRRSDIYEVQNVGGSTNGDLGATYVRWVLLQEILRTMPKKTVLVLGDHCKRDNYVRLGAPVAPVETSPLPISLLDTSGQFGRSGYSDPVGVSPRHSDAAPRNAPDVVISVPPCA